PVTSAVVVAVVDVPITGRPFVHELGVGRGVAQVNGEGLVRRVRNQQLDCDRLGRFAGVELHGPVRRDDVVHVGERRVVHHGEVHRYLLIVADRQAHGEGDGRSVVILPGVADADARLVVDNAACGRAADDLGVAVGGTQVHR